MTFATGRVPLAPNTKPGRGAAGVGGGHLGAEPGAPNPRAGPQEQRGPCRGGRSEPRLRGVCPGAPGQAGLRGCPRWGSPVSEQSPQREGRVSLVLQKSVVSCIQGG